MNKQSTTTRRFGIIALIGAMISGLTDKPQGMEVKDLQARRTMLLTNGGVAPIPRSLPNQRQRRKTQRQTGRCAK